MKDALRILRYNTGTDKKVFVELKDCFDAVIFNATIVAHSGSSVADLVSMHKRKYLIDPQTHIFQQELSAIKSTGLKAGPKDIKQSVKKYFGELPEELSSLLLKKWAPLMCCEIVPFVDALVSSVYSFQTEFVQRFIKEKDYDKYLQFAHVGPEPKMVIAPYFMIKAEYTPDQIDEWLALNSDCVKKTVELAAAKKASYPVAAQLVMDKDVLCSLEIAAKIAKAYSSFDFEYVFLWIDELNLFDTSEKYLDAFAILVKALNSIGKKPIMAYGGYESILLCHEDSPCRLYGVAQSVGYGEYRSITPVGGGFPVNKYYFPPLHLRMRFDEVADILSDKQYFTDSKTSHEHAEDYYKTICNCKMCHAVIKNDINNFVRYNDSTSFTVTTKKAGTISRNRPTTDASLIAAMHFLHSKIHEWSDIETASFESLLDQLKSDYTDYMPKHKGKISKWCEIYGK